MRSLNYAKRFNKAGPKQKHKMLGDVKKISEQMSEPQVNENYDAAIRSELVDQKTVRLNISPFLMCHVPA